MILLATLFLAGHAHALDAPHLPAFEIFDQLKESPDAHLDEMRGRFVSADGVTAFGVVMESVWQTSRGDVYGAGMELLLDGTDASLAFRPIFTFHSSQDHVAMVETGKYLTLSLGPLTDSRGRVVIDSAGLNNVSGVSQGIHIAADSNRVDNSVAIDIFLDGGGAGSVQVVDGQPAMPAPAIAPAESIAQAVADVSAASVESLKITSVQGVRLSSGFSPEGALVAIELPGEGRIVQSIGGGQFTAAGIRQNAEVLSQLNTIQNSIRIIAQLQDNALLNQAGNALSQRTLMGLRELGAVY